jgi:hypothetical protein
MFYIVQVFSAFLMLILVLLQISHTLALIGTLNAAISGEGEGKSVAKLQQYQIL